MTHEKRKREKKLHEDRETGHTGRSDAVSPAFAVWNECELNCGRRYAAHVLSLQCSDMLYLHTLIP